MNYYLYNYSRFIQDTKFISFFKSSEYPNKPKIQIGFRNNMIIMNIRD